MKALCTVMLAASAGTAALAVPAQPKPITVTQPDGTKITVCLRGDEHLNWAETIDGFTLLRDTQGYWAFAETSTDGNLVASALRYDGTTTAATSKGIRKGLRFSATQVKEAFGRPLSNAFNKPQGNTMLKTTDKTEFMVDGTFPATGKRKLLVLLVNYQDTKTTYSKEDIQRMMTEKNYNGIGSLRDYYLEQSYGKLDLDIVVSDWIDLPKPKGTYGPDGATYMIYDALSTLSKTMDLKQFDNDGDGILDGLAVIHQGTGQESSGDGTEIWSHSSIIYGQKFNGITVRRYTIQPEVNANTRKMQQIGVIAHEFGHALGAPDFYDSDYSSSGGEFCGTGVWDLLANGAWSGEYGSCPTGVNGWQKWVWGWTEPTVLDETTTVSDMPSAVDEPVAYRMETGTPGEYFYMENRQNTKGFDRSLPGHGLIIYHVNENIIKSKVYENTINATYPQGIYTVCSDAGFEPDSHPSSFGSVNSQYAPFPGAKNHTEFSDNTLPSAKSLEGRASYRALSNITENNGKIGFQFTHFAEPLKPVDFAATTAAGKVTLTWQMPDGADEIDHFNVYRNNEMISSTTECTYTDEKPEDGKLITYQVDVAYKNGKLSHPVSTSILVPQNYVKEYTATAIADNTVKMEWGISNVLSRADLFAGTSATVDIYGEEVEYANCYTADDLSNYVGGKITKMAFCPSQGPSEINVSFRIWEGDANGENMKVVSERSVKEFATAQRREVKLTTPVVIKAGKTYWIAVRNVCTKNVVSPICDKTTILAPGRGNCVLKNGKFEAYPEAPGNFYVEATMTLPAATEGTDYADAPSGEMDVDNGLFYPLCYVVHCDGKPLAYTTKREKTFSDIPAGTHTFAVSSYYNGGNESMRLTQIVEVPGDLSAINETSANRAVVSCRGGFLSVAGYTGTVTVSDVAGSSRTYSVNGSGDQILLAPGVNIVRIGGNVYKVTNSAR